ncbi:hypothetical protein CLCR_09047 [Cladophialophora carrionii]|uniref:Uncharacterized protein n=1 Tax=Cladophialophora carrionii TaxID=86049 RepID=A0A1C1CRR9_9EURO|nr:hypothetical protein CLCR_09047 [Cladophialophora carrionii]
MSSDSGKDRNNDKSKDKSKAMSKDKNTNKAKLEGILESHNQVLENNTISQNRVLRQLAQAPAPGEKGRSGHPRKYEDKEELFPKRSNSPTIDMEYPVTQHGPPYNFKSKPKDDPGAFRAITNQNKDYKGTICHDGDRKANNPNAGLFHLCEPRGNSKDRPGIVAQVPEARHNEIPRPTHQAQDNPVVTSTTSEIPSNHPRQGT